MRDTITETIIRKGVRVTIKIPIEKVIFIRAEEKYSMIYHLDGEVVSDTRIFEFDERFDCLIEASRGLLVNFDYIEKIYGDIAGYAVKLTGWDKEILYISRRCYINTFRKLKLEMVDKG